MPHRHGLSPRGRGNRRPPGVCRRDVRSIPAWAGEPPVTNSIPQHPTVYPRVGGGTCPGFPWSAAQRGLSPRGRGNQKPPVRTATPIGSIPAWAGEPPAKLCWLRRITVYPRVGGGTEFVWPRRFSYWGLSPRGRGNHGRVTYGSNIVGSIPAWAGEPTSEWHKHIPDAVYPRVGGGTRRWSIIRLASLGLSPRGRGNPGLKEIASGVFRSIPAWAGEPQSPYRRQRLRWVYPRVGGGTSLGPRRRGGSWGLSPRGRGNPFKARLSKSTFMGLSPRGRGNR